MSASPTTAVAASRPSVEIDKSEVLAAIDDDEGVALIDVRLADADQKVGGMNDWRPFVYGGLASMTAECGTFPIDTTKTRLQIQGQLIDARHTELKYRGMLHAFFRILNEEGLHALYSGISPALLRQATYGTIKIGVYHTLKRLVVPDPRHETLGPNVLCGIAAGVIGSSIANPTDVLKVRMQARGTSDKGRSMLQSFLQIYRDEGINGLWRGVGPTAQRAAVVAGVELPAYDHCKKLIIHSGYLGDTKTTHFVSSFLAGLAGAIASNPIDVVKMVCLGPLDSNCPTGFVFEGLGQTRLMNQQKLKASVGVGGVTPAIYTSAADCFVQTVRSEGFMALYKGFIPTWVRLGPWNIIFFMTYEQLKKAY